MNTNSNAYTIIYAAVMVVIVAFVLSFTSASLKERQLQNVELDKKKQILASLKIDYKGQDAATLYAQHVKQEVIVNEKGEVIAEAGAFNLDVKKELAKEPNERHLPLYICDVNGEKKFVFSMYGAGLWGPIWGYLSTNADLNTVYGTYFSHAGETPGLGAEIANPNFQRKFEGKKILNASGQFVSIEIVKPGQAAEGKDYVDGISGGTITSKAVDVMMMNCVGQYANYIKKEKGE